ncbi:tetratricopeptide repeat protein [Flavicella sp.]|uniref:tetratricopeptide repeat protein n=1 Tax=Flavicella sp. TaxID=2957742 RepID=UPI00301806AC
MNCIGGKKGVFFKFKFLIVVLITFISSCNEKKTESYSRVNHVHAKSKFVGSKTCKECHQKETVSWMGSHHDMAMKVADSTTVLGDFNMSEFVHKKMKTSFYMKGKDYYVTTTNKKGIPEEYKIVYTFGVAPLQQYIVAFPNGAFQCLLTAWDSVENKWFHLQEDVNLKHDEWLNWTGASSNWNTMCADCHSTNLKKNFDSKTGHYKTTFSEINVSCEACHGPASTHVSYYKNPLINEQAPEMYMQTNMDTKELVDKCARCHSRRTQITGYFDYKGTFMDHYIPRLLEPPTYELDGQIKDEVYVYASFVQSKMYHNGVSCKDCHDVHSLKLKKQGNDLCMNCHIPSYDTPEHHHHKQGSKQSMCINCHMVGKVYMGNDHRRDHSFRIPRPDQSEKFGTPNACIFCHKDKTNNWAAKAIVKNYGTKRADHFSDYLLEGNAGNKGALLKLISSEGYPEISRATAMSHLITQRATREEVAKIAEKLNSSSALLRREAVTSIEKIRDVSYLNQIKPLLKDSVRSVRIAAVSYLVTLKVKTEKTKFYKKAEKEYLDFLDMNSDFASGQLKIAEYLQSKGELDLAIKAYEKAIKIDSYYNIARMNLALLFYQKNKWEKSIQLYNKVIELEPEFGYSYYMLGLLYSELNQPKKAIDYMKLATEKNQTNYNAFYNYALMLQKLNKINKSLQVLEKALYLFPNNEKLLYAKLITELNSNLIEKALKSCKLLIEIDSDNTRYHEILSGLEKNNFKKEH